MRDQLVFSAFDQSEPAGICGLCPPKDGDGEFLYGMEALNLFVKVLNLWMQPYKNLKSSYTEISFSLLLAFDIDVSVKYLADKIRYARMDSYDFAELMEKSGEMV